MDRVEIEFIKKYPPHEKGDVKEFDVKIAEFYLNNGIAKIHQISTPVKGFLKLS